MAFAPPARHLLRAKDLADARYFEPLEVGDMADVAGLSRAHFSREFRRAFGDSPHAYLLTRRLERAAALLRSTDRSVADICFSVGLASVGSFTTSFTRTYGARRPPTAGHSRRRASTRSFRRCVVRLYGRPQHRTFGEDSESDAGLASRATVPSTRRTPMIKIANAQLWVNDQDEALAFYTQKLGMEVRADVTLAEMGNFRWLTVGPAGRPDVAIALMAIPGPPVMDAGSAEQLRSLMAKGFAGTVFLATDDCRASYEELTGLGVEFSEPPEERPYGIDSGFRDPSGNSIRLTQVRELAGV